MGIIQANAAQARGIRPVPSISLGGTDARLWRLAGIPAYVYGPTPTNMGAPNECVTLDDLFGTVQVHVLSAYDYLAGRSNFSTGDPPNRGPVSEMPARRNRPSVTKPKASFSTGCRTPSSCLR
jgi:hypothetical protein